MVRGEQPFWISRYSKNSAINNSKVILSSYLLEVASFRKSYNLRNDFMLTPFTFSCQVTRFEAVCCAQYEVTLSTNTKIAIKLLEF